ncbi:adenylate/guanylate cyclase domain-containing protein [Nonomuraea sp. MCN248]|uniref:Adenylate/guanylate cyclase domain-containing protein n=1 Tax=Nonomuraea corallina TaxID=2989783 RepID=A0ABT4SDM2_9ACTN|nr:adenylate/guanylate cyclase domain-containing protein [Nonomuraea corallina]MDA0635284.1 adenylate/guanylate cyclase domain-containing protein [Nonomuraea corallina]
MDERAPTARQIERLLSGLPSRFTRKEVSAEAGVSRELAERIWRALGFATLADDAVAFSDADVEALSRVRTMLDSGTFDEESVVRMARALGQTTSRLAQWQAEIVIGAMVPGGREPSAGDLDRVLETARTLLPDFERLLIHVWRAQLAAASARLLAVAAVGDEPVPIAVGFADLVSFTRRSRDLPERDLAALVEGFESRAADVVAAHGARLVKTLGDEVLFTASTPAQAAAIALDLVDAEELRVGLAYGPVLPMLGDVFGTTVNLAARLTAIAAPGTILTDEALAGALKGDGRFTVHRHRRRQARGLGVVRPHVLRRSAS